MNSQAGALVQMASDLNFALQSHFNIGLEDVSLAEFRALQVIRSESDKLSAEPTESNGVQN